jgi:hypothetical protein
MAKTIYVYFNADDLSELLNGFMQIGVPLYDNVQGQISRLPFVVENITEIGLYSQEKGCVFYSPCMYIGNQLQCGSFCLTQEKCPNSLKLFSQIKKAIRSKYAYSKENACYYGPGFYHDWVNKRFCLPVLLDFDKIEITAERIENLFSTLQNSCFCVKPNNVRLRDAEKVDLSTSSFIIYSNENLLVPTIIRKSWIRYEYDSACIFAFKDESKGIYSFMFDRRLTNDSPELRMLFDGLICI